MKNGIKIEKSEEKVEEKPAKKVAKKSEKITEIPQSNDENKITKNSQKEMEDEGFVAESAKYENRVANEEKIETQKQVLDEVFGKDEEKESTTATENLQNAIQKEGNKNSVKMATEYQISTIVGFVKKLAGTLPYAEQTHKLLKTIVAICGIEIVKENEE